MTASLSVRYERRTYSAATLAELDALEAELAPMGWVPLGQTMCPAGCTCGEGPYHSAFALRLPVTDKEMN